MLFYNNGAFTLNTGKWAHLWQRLLQKKLCKKRICRETNQISATTPEPTTVEPTTQQLSDKALCKQLYGGIDMNTKFIKGSHKLIRMGSNTETDETEVDKPKTLLTLARAPYLKDNIYSTLVAFSRTDCGPDFLEKLNSGDVT